MTLIGAQLLDHASWARVYVCVCVCTYQAAGEANNSNRIVGRLCRIKQVVQECLVFVVSKQVKLIKQEHNTLVSSTS